MNFIDFYAGQNDCDRRLDRVLKSIFKDVDASNYFKALRKKLILVNDMKSSPDYRVKVNDKISIAEFILKKQNSNTSLLDDTDSSIEIILKTPDILFVNKKSGIQVQPSKSDEKSLSQMVAAYCSKNMKADSSLSFRIGPLHRLDKYTSGLIAFSQSLKGAQYFSKALQSGEIKKTYIGIICGTLTAKVRWEDSIEDFSKDKARAAKKTFHTVQVIPATDKNVAITNAKPLSFGEFEGKSITLVQFDIETGRKHQIRAQSSFHGYPLLGDIAYGGEKLSGKAFFLHALSLSFTKDNQLSLPDKITAPLPKDFSNFIKSFLINCHEDFII